MLPPTHDALVKKAAKAYQRTLLQRPGVTMVRSGYKVTNGVRTATPAVVIGVKRKLPKRDLAPSEILPERLEINGSSVATDVVEAEFKALEDPERIGRMRPAVGGISVGHISITAGTLSLVVKRNGKPVILSNNHVLAASGQAAIGSSIVQPGAYDGGVEPADLIATLEDFVPITFESGGGLPDLPECPTAIMIVNALNWLAQTLGRATRLAVAPRAEEPNLVDAAVAAPITEDLVIVETILAENGNRLQPKGLVPAAVGMEVWKAGRTTGYTEGGTIEAIDGAVRVSYGDLGTAVFESQLVVQSATRFSQGGDSGSAVLTADNQLVGLLFAGDEAGTMTVCCPMTEVFRLLGLSL